MKIFTYLSLIIFLGISSHVYADAIKKGKKLAFERKKGNCLACHLIEDGELAGNAGPPLLAMKARFPNKKDLFNKIWDATKSNPHTFMRSEERRVGKECPLLCRSRWSPYH